MDPLLNNQKNKLNIIFFGTPHFAVPTLEELLHSDIIQVRAVVTQPDRPAGRGHKLQASPIKELAIKHNIPVLQPERIKKNVASFIDQLKQFGEIDFGIVVAFGQILPIQVLEFPKYGCINIHGSILPRWRGAAPMQRAIMSGDKESGVSIMQMDVGLDSGAVYNISKVSITENTTLEDLHNELATLGAKTLLNCLPTIAKGELPAITQPEQGITIAKKIEEAETKINWNQPAKLLAQHIHGISPFPGAYTFYNGIRLKIYRVLAHDQRPTEANDNLQPGQVFRCDKNHLWITCNPGVLEILELQLAGKKRMSITDFLKGVQVHPLDQLGNENGKK